MIFIKTKYYPAKGFNAITHWPFVFYKKDSVEMRRHEYIHGRQQLEMLIFGRWTLYYIIYIILWLKNGYRTNPLEKEAYENDKNIAYHLYRKPFSWLKYLK